MVKLSSKSSKQRALSLLAGLALLVLGVGLYGCKDSLQLWGPTLDVRPSHTVGLAPTPILVSASDERGISSLRVVQNYGDIKKVLLAIDYSPESGSLKRPSSVLEELYLNADANIPVSSKLLLEVSATNGSGSSSSRKIEIPYNSSTPEISVISAPSKLDLGEPGVAILQAKGELLESVGVMIGSDLFEGIPLRTLSVNGDSNKFISVFTVTSQDEAAKIKVYARNSAHNTVSRSLRLSTSPYKKTLRRRIRFKGEDVERLISATTTSLQRETTLMDPSVVFFEGGLSPITSPRTFFGSVLEVNIASISRLIKRDSSQSNFQIKGDFRNPGGDLIAPLWSNLEILVDNNTYPVENFPFEIRETGQVSVDSIGEGTVIFNENLGPLGNVVGVDHGLGIIAVYGLLESSRISVGSRVLANTPVGTPIRRGSGRFGTYILGGFAGGKPIKLSKLTDKNWTETNLQPHIRP